MRPPTMFGEYGLAARQVIMTSANKRKRCCVRGILDWFANETIVTLNVVPTLLHTAIS